MIIRLHKQACTTPDIRTELQAGNGAPIELAQRYYVSISTILK